MLLLDRLLMTVLSPRTWLLAMALCLGVWVVLGYHQDQMDAAIALGESPTGIFAAIPVDALISTREKLLFSALCLLGVACFLALPIWSRFKTQNGDAPTEPEPQPDASSAFQPIRTQKELVDDLAKAKPPTGRRVSRVATQLVQSAVSALQSPKNQP